jgi:DNA-binding NarL/FixJ family response regulator
MGELVAVSPAAVQASASVPAPQMNEVGKVRSANRDWNHNPPASPFAAASQASSVIGAASGFVLKVDPPEQLLAAIRTVAAGDALLSPAITKRVIKQFTRLPRPAPPQEFEQLTERDLDVFRSVARGLSNVEIGRELFIGG